MVLSVGPRKQEAVIVFVTVFWPLDMRWTARQATAWTRPPSGEQRTAAGKAARCEAALADLGGDLLAQRYRRCAEHNKPREY